MTVAAILISFANRAQPVSSGLALILNSSISLEEIEAIVKEASRNTPVQAETTIAPILDAITKALEGKASVAELKVLTVDTELFS